MLHGEAVGLGILVQCALDPGTALGLEEMGRYFYQLGAPTRFADVGFDDIAGEAGRRLAAATLDLLDLDRAVPFPVAVDALHAAMCAIDDRA